MRTVVFGTSANPAGVHHLEIAQLLAGMFDQVKIVACGPRPDKLTVNDIDPVHRAAMIDLTFGPLAPKVDVDLSDLELATFTRTHDLDARYARDGGEVWHFVGTDLLAGGKDGLSPIQKKWAYGPELWERLNFAVGVRDGIPFDRADLPPKHILFRSNHDGASEKIRIAASLHRPLDGLVTPAVRDYIERNELYRGGSKETELVLEDPRLLIIADTHNPQALELAKRMSSLSGKPRPNLVVAIGGDGTMLRTIRNAWRLRLPFLGINTGHLGFLLNEVADGDITPEFFRQNFVIRRSPLLHVEFEQRDGTTKQCLAFNDAWLQSEPGKTSWFEVLVDGEVRIPRLVGDGILVATAAGSTASARAMGASPFLVGTDLLVIVGSNVSFPLHWRTGANVPLDSVVEFRNADPDGWRKTFGFADGVALGDVISMRVRRSRIAAAELVFLRNNDLRRKVILSQFP